MDLKVFWTDTALFQLEDIFKYYKVKASIKVAKTLAKRIIDSTIVLGHNPRIGQKEELLQNRKREYRYIIEGNYKIIYWIEDQYVKIASVFDCRQNPNKIEKIK